MATLPAYERGIDTSVLTVYKQTVDPVTGVLSNDTVFGIMDLLATVDSMRTRSANRMVSLSPMTRRQENNVPVETGTTWTFVGLLKRIGANPARRVAYGYNPGTPLAAGDYVLATWIHGQVTEVFRGVVETFDQDVTKERAQYTLVLRHHDDLSVGGAAVNNPDFSGVV